MARSRGVLIWKLKDFPKYNRINRYNPDFLIYGTVKLRQFLTS